MSEMSMKKFFILLLLLPVSLAATAEDFLSPAPPPELGENLTSYRTQQQKQEHLRQPEKRPERNNRQDAAASKGAAAAPPAPEVPLMKEVYLHYRYVPNKKVSVFKNGETLIKLVDSRNQPVPVSGVQVSNDGFRVEKSHDGSLIIRPTGLNTVAKLRIVPGASRNPLIFVLSYNYFRQDLRSIEEVKI